jgi:predicted Zn-dependent protease
VGGSDAGWLGAAASYAYSNPFAVASTTTAFQPTYSYSEPIPAYTEPQPVAPTIVVNAPQGDTTVVTDSQGTAPATPGVIAPQADTSAAPQPAAAPEDPKVTQAVALFDPARELFRKGDYAGAQARVDQAIGILPQDRVLHEFRALTLFAQQKYPDAASTLYAVLSAGPGWNWETVKSFYPDVDTYTKQLRALEAHARANPKSADDRFVQAYHYLVVGSSEQAIKMLEQVHDLVPNDQLTVQILAALKPKPSANASAPPAAKD